MQSQKWRLYKSFSRISNSRRKKKKRPQNMEESAYISWLKAHLPVTQFVIDTCANNRAGNSICSKRDPSFLIKHPRKEENQHQIERGVNARFIHAQRMLDLFGFPDFTAASLPPDVSSPPHESFNCRARRIQGWSDVQIEYGFARGLRWSRIVINHIADFLRTGSRLTGYKPVVSVKRRLRTG
jgi:hypothetical protein